MKSTVFSAPLLLVAMLAVPWVVAAPLEAAPEEEDYNAALKEFLERNPSLANNLFPKLVNAANYVSLTLEPDVVSDLLEKYAEEATAHEIMEELEEEEEAETEEEPKEHERQKRQTSVFGTINGSGNPYAKSIGGSGTVKHAWDKGLHSASGTVGGQRDTVKGLGSVDSYNAGVGYNYSPNEQTSYGINVHKSLTPAINAQSIGGLATVNRGWENKGQHTLSGTIGGQKDTVKGLGSAKSYNAGLGYNYSPNKKTSFGINAHKNWSPAGKSHGVELSFTHRFQG